MSNFAAAQLGRKFEKFTESLLSSISIYAVQNRGNFQQVLLLPGNYHNLRFFLSVSLEMEGY